MKRQFMLFLLMSLFCLLLAGCQEETTLEVASGVADQVIQETRPSASARQGGAFAAQEGITYAVEKTVSEDTVTSQTGNVTLAEYHYELPSLSALRADGTVIDEAKTKAEQLALEVTAEFDHQFVTWQASDTVLELSADVQEEYNTCLQDKTAFTPHHFRLTFTTWQTEHLVSIQATYYSDSGDAHPSTILMAWNFDTDVGAFVEPVVLAEDGKAFQEAVKEEIIRQADARVEEQGVAPETIYWENYQEVAGDWMSYAVSFNDQGMTVGFSRYEMASYAAGDQEFTLSNAFLAPYLSAYGQQVLDLSEKSNGAPD